MKLLRRYVLCVLGILCVVAVRAQAESVSQLPKPTSYVADFAGVIDADSKQEMEQLSLEVYEKAHATIEVVTVHSLDGADIDQFTTDLEDKWKVGPKGSDRGVLMILAINDHKRRIEVGYGLEGILNDAKVGDIGRNMVPMLRQDQYGPALLSAEQQIAGVIAADANVTLTAPVSQPVEQPYRTQRHGGNGWLGFVIFIIIMGIFLGGGRGGGWLPWFLLGNILGGGFGGRGGGGFGGGGGGFGGGGGGDFGGGFGGGSGGGGASGDW